MAAKRRHFPAGPAFRFRASTFFSWPAVVPIGCADFGTRLRPWTPLAWPVLIGVQYFTHDRRRRLLVLERWVGVRRLVHGRCLRWTGDHRLVRWGDVTYGIYLVHMPALFILDCLAHDRLTPCISDMLVVCSAPAHLRSALPSESWNPRSIVSFERD